MIILGDHATPCKLKNHSSDPVPILIYDPSKKPDQTSGFNEVEALKGSLGKVLGKNFVKKIGIVWSHWRTINVINQFLLRMVW